MTPKRFAPLAAAALLVAGCGGSSGGPADAGHQAGGTVSGLAPGASVTLQLTAAGAGPQSVTVSANGAFRFPAHLNSGVDWTVAVTDQPQVPKQTCQVAPDGGTVVAFAGAEVTMAVTCTTDTFQVGGTVEWLALDTSVTLRAADGEVLVVTARNDSPTRIPFTFLAPVASGQPYAVTVLHQPTNPSQTCQVASGTGTVTTLPVSNVTVTCERNTKPVKVQVSGFAGTTPLVVQVNGAFDTEATSDALLDVLTNLANGASYTVTVLTQPTSPWQTCQVVSGADGTMTASGGDVTAQVLCTTDTFQVGGTVSGQLKPGLVLTNGGGDDLTVNGDGSFVFPTAVPSGQPYLVAVKTQPPTQVCVVTNQAGTIGDAAVADVAVTCLCAPGLANCDGDQATGCETSTLTDAGHCGSCGHVCQAANGTSTCQAGACQLAGCLGTFENCNHDASDGCEVNTASDPLHCGTCTKVCGFPNMAPACASGTCGRGDCLAGWADCDGDLLNGCETDLTSDPLHCGSCGKVCSFLNAGARCVAQACQIGACADGFGNCDNDDATGCEASLSSDPLHCGSCINACSLPNATASCQAPFTCAVDVCQGTFQDCNNGPSDGCEVDTANDGLHCGSCTKACALPNARPSCAGGACNTAQCVDGYKDCDHDLLNGCEKPVGADVQNCGGCDIVCDAELVCGGGSCVRPRSCNEILQAGRSHGDDVYTIDPSGTFNLVQVWCDMTSDPVGGAWTFFAHVGADYQAGRLFELDEGVYDPARGGGATYGLGGAVYQHLGATELMVSVINPDPGVTLGSSLVFYRFPVGHLSFKTGPVPCDPTDPALEYATGAGYLTGSFGVCDPDNWLPVDAAGNPLVTLSGAAALGTGLGGGVDPTMDPANLSFGLESWWYAR